MTAAQKAHDIGKMQEALQLGDSDLAHAQELYKQLASFPDGVKLADQVSADRAQLAADFGGFEAGDGWAEGESVRVGGFVGLRKGVEKSLDAARRSVLLPGGRAKAEMKIGSCIFAWIGTLPGSPGGDRRGEDLGAARRGGAGFPTWIKWNGLPKNYDAPHYIICNADEGEPGTYKDRELMLKLAHTLVEGMIIAGYATYTKVGYIYIRGEYVEPAWQVRKAIDQAYKAGFLGKNILGVDGFDFDLHIHLGAGSYECGEESALMSSLMGERGNPRLKFPHAPLPVVQGVSEGPDPDQQCRDLLRRRRHIAHDRRGVRQAGNRAQQGHQDHLGQRAYREAGQLRDRDGHPPMELVEEAGGVINGRLKAVIPGGSSVQIMTAEQCKKINLDYESCAANGTLLGFWRLHGVQRHDGHRVVNEAHSGVLHARVLRQMHAVPRGHPLALQDHRSHHLRRRS